MKSVWMPRAEKFRYGLLGLMAALVAAWLVPGAVAGEAGPDPVALYEAGKYSQAAEGFAQKDMENPRQTRWRYNRGVAAFKAGEMEAAQGAFASAGRRAVDDEEVQYASAYNLGNTAFAAQDFPAAVEHYKKALAARPESEDAQANLQLALWHNKLAQEQEKQQCENPQEGQDGEEGEEGEEGEQEGEQGEQKGEQGEQKGDSKQDQGQQEQKEQQGEQKPGDQQQGQDQQTGQGEQEEEEPAPQDLSGELATSQPMDSSQAPPQDAQKPQGMEQRKAEALLDNVQENPMPVLQRMKGEQSPRSGKSW